MKKIMFIITFITMIFVSLYGIDSYIDLGTDFDYGKIQNLWFVNDSVLFKVDTTNSMTLFKQKLVIDTIQAEVGDITRIRKVTIDTLICETLNVDIADIDTLTVDTAKIYKADIDTLTADSIKAIKVVGDTIWVNGLKMYKYAGDYVTTDNFRASVLQVAAFANIMKLQNYAGYTFNLNCGDNYNDSIIFVLTGAGGDTVATIDSFNTVRVKNEVAEEKPGFFVYQDSNTVETTISISGVWYAVNNWTVMDTDHVTVLNDTLFVMKTGGEYFVHCSMSASATASGDVYDMGLFVNDTLYSNALITERYFSSSNVGSWSFIGKVTIQPNDTVSLKIRDITGTKNLLFKYGQFLMGIE